MASLQFVPNSNSSHNCNLDVFIFFPCTNFLKRLDLDDLSGPQADSTPYQRNRAESFEKAYKTLYIVSLEPGLSLFPDISRNATEPYGAVQLCPTQVSRNPSGVAERDAQTTASQYSRHSSLFCASWDHKGTPCWYYGMYHRAYCATRRCLLSLASKYFLIHSIMAKQQRYGYKRSILGGRKVGVWPLRHELKL